MKITGLIWLYQIVEKLSRKHSVSQDEVIEVFANSRRFRFIESGHRLGENVYSLGGQTDGGRFLLIYFVYKTGREALILSARDMTRSEKKRYERK